MLLFSRPDLAQATSAGRVFDFACTVSRRHFPANTVAKDRLASAFQCFTDHRPTDVETVTKPHGILGFLQTDADVQILFFEALTAFGVVIDCVAVRRFAEIIAGILDSGTPCFFN